MQCKADGNQCVYACEVGKCYKYVPPRGNAKPSEPNKWQQLKELCGHLQDGSQTTVTMFQDDATRTCFIKVDKKTYFADSFDQALILAVEGNK